MWIVLTLAVAHGQGVEPERFNGQVMRPSSDAHTTLWTEGTAVAPDGYGTARLFVHYANGLVRWRGGQAQADRLVSDVFELDLLGAWHWRGLRLGAHLPIYGLTAGQGASTKPGLGDVAVDLKATILDGERDPLGAALMGRLLLPTASVSLPLGSSGTGWEAIGVIDRDLDPFLLAANIGIRDVPRAVIDDLVWNDQIFARIAGSYALSDRAGASVELGAQTNWASQLNPAGTAVELMGAGYGALSGDLVLRGGLSLGLSRSPGAPAVRLLAGLSWEPDPYPDGDLDGLLDRDDGCPSEAEDPDGYEDWDGCPDPEYTVQFTVRDPAGRALDALIVLDGADSQRLDAGDSYATLHPGLYRVVAQVDGYQPWTGELEVAAEQGQQLQIEVTPRLGGIRIWAVDTSGNRLDASVRIDGAQPRPADGEPIDVKIGEHSLIVTAEGYRAKAVSVEVSNGQERAVSVVLDPLVTDEDGAPLRRTP